MSGLQGMRILVVEDRRELLDLFELLLAADGAVVATAATGCEAFELASVCPFDAALCDLGLPDIDGAVVVRHLTTATLEPPVVAVISGHDDERLDQARAAGAQAVFRKPVEWAHVVAFLSRLRIQDPATTDAAA
jgi:CheY-like chemotaxis protein